jgi:hypothetical protein
MIVFWGRGLLCGGGVVGPCPGCPEGGGKGWWGVALCSLSPALPGKGLRTLAFTEQVPGPGSSSLLMMMMVPGPPCPFSFSVVVMGLSDRQGPITNSSSEDETPTFGDFVTIILTKGITVARLQSTVQE